MKQSVMQRCIVQLFAYHAVSTVLCYNLNKRLIGRKFQDIFVRFNSKSNNQNTAPREGIGLPKGYANPQFRYILDRHCLSGIPNVKNPFLVLGIETSCDDTGVAIVSSNGTILSNVVYSQYSVHERFGGVVPGLAMNAHKENIEIAVTEALQKAGLSSVADVDGIAVTKGPGLEICLRVGMRKAQSLAKEFRKPFVTVHHLEAHALIARLAGVEVVLPDSEALPDTVSSSMPHFQPKVAYPFLALLVSGGHTSLLICRGLGEYSVIGGTLDDSLGEAFDKAARLVGLRTDGSGGAAVEKAAARGRVQSLYEMSVPMRDKANCDFSYAGLKNSFRLAVLNARKSVGLPDGTNAPAGQHEESPELISLPDGVAADLCHSFQHVAFSHVEDRVGRAMDYFEDHSPMRTRSDPTETSSSSPFDATIVVVGGVAANLELRRRLLALIQARKDRFGSEFRWRLVFPPVMLCTDNGVMAAWSGIEKFCEGISDEAESQEVIAKWPMGSPIGRGENVFKKRDKKKKTQLESL